MLDLHCKLNPLLFHIHTQNFHFHDIPDADDLQRMLDKAVTHLRDMYHPDGLRYQQRHRNQ